MSLDVLATIPMGFNIATLMKPNMIDDKEFAGTVIQLADPQDSRGRIKVMIDPIFNGIDPVDLPWISMGGYTNILTKPVVGDIVIVRFRGSIYEGFYAYAYVTKKRLESLHLAKYESPKDLGSGFEFNLDKVAIFGTYDGNNLDIVTSNFIVSIDNTKGTATIKGSGQINVDGSITVINQGTAPVLNTQTLCQYSGLPHVSLVPNILVG